LVEKLLAEAMARPEFGFLPLGHVDWDLAKVVDFKD